MKRADLVLEVKLGRPLIAGEIAHHKNENKEDDSPDNLELMTLANHTRLHHPKKTQALKSNHPSRRRFVWPEDEELLKMAETMTLREIAPNIGCTWSAVGRRIKKARQK